MRRETQISSCLPAVGQSGSQDSMPPWCEGRAKCTVPNPRGLLDILSAGCPDIGLQKGRAPVTHMQAPMK